METVVLIQPFDVPDGADDVFLAAAVASEAHGVGMAFAGGIPVLDTDVRSVRAGAPRVPAIRPAA
jgi:hypothetical protein